MNCDKQSGRCTSVNKVISEKQCFCWRPNTMVPAEWELEDLGLDGAVLKTAGWCGSWAAGSSSLFPSPFLTPFTCVSKCSSLCQSRLQWNHDSRSLVAKMSPWENAKWIARVLCHSDCVSASCAHRCSSVFLTTLLLEAHFENMCKCMLQWDTSIQHPRVSWLTQKRNLQEQKRPLKMSVQLRFSFGSVSVVATNEHSFCRDMVPSSCPWSLLLPTLQKDLCSEMDARWLSGGKNTSRHLRTHS